MRLTERQQAHCVKLEDRVPGVEGSEVPERDQLEAHLGSAEN